MSDSVIQVENLWKEYRLGVINHHTLTHDIQSWWARLWGKEDPNSPIGSRHFQPEDRFWALKDVSFEVKQGDILGIIGRNGAGKSTLLKILSQVTAPTKGEARFKGRIASLLEVGTGFHPELTGHENIFLNGAILGMSKVEIRSKLDDIIDFAEVEKFIDTPVKRYSSGMYVRLAFAIAAHLEPEILIVDEVLAVGDAQFQKKCLGKMEEVGKEGRTVLFVSHNMNAINRLCKKAILLSAGQIICQGGTDTVLPTYLNLVETNIRSIAFFPDDPGKPYQVLSISLHNEDGSQLNNTIGANHSLRIKVCYKVSKPLPGGYAGLLIKNQNGEIVLFSDNRDCSKSGRLENPRIITLMIQIPAPLLVSGRYTVSATIARLPMGTIDAQQDAVSFEIEDLSGIRQNRPGYVYLPLTWEETD